MQIQSRRKEETLEVSGIAPEVRQLLVAISHAISLERMELPDEFYPSHLPVALINAVSGKRAEELVRRCAYELILAPRFLDFEIWKRRGV